MSGWQAYLEETAAASAPACELDEDLLRARLGQLLHLAVERRIDDDVCVFADDPPTLRGLVYLSAISPDLERVLLQWEPQLFARFWTRDGSTLPPICEVPWTDVPTLVARHRYGRVNVRDIMPEYLEEAFRRRLELAVNDVRCTYQLTAGRDVLQACLPESARALYKLALAAEEQLPPDEQALPAGAAESDKSELLPLARQLHRTAFYSQTQGGFHRFSYSDRRELCFVSQRIHEGTQGFYMWKRHDGTVKAGCYSEFCKKTIKVSPPTPAPT